MKQNRRQKRPRRKPLRVVIYARQSRDVQSQRNLNAQRKRTVQLLRFAFPED